MASRLVASAVPTMKYVLQMAELDKVRGQTEAQEAQLASLRAENVELAQKASTAVELQAEVSTLHNQVLSSPQKAQTSW